jgi:hypothetical protein
LHSTIPSDIGYHLFLCQILKKVHRDAKRYKREAQQSTKPIKTKEDDAIKHFARKCAIICTPFLDKDVLGCSFEPLPDSLDELYMSTEASNLALLHELHDMLPKQLATLLKKGDEDFIQKVCVFFEYVPKLILDIFPISKFLLDHKEHRRNIVYKVKSHCTEIFGHNSGDRKGKEALARLLGLEHENEGVYPELPPVLFPNGEPSTKGGKDIFRSEFIIKVRHKVSYATN